MGSRWLLSSFIVVLNVAVLCVVGPETLRTGAASPGDGPCRLQEVANVVPPLGAVSAGSVYDFTGTVNRCRSNIAGSPATGAASGGVQLPETVTLIDATTGATTTGTVLYREAIAQVSGSCDRGTMLGEALAARPQRTVVASMTLALAASSVPSTHDSPATFTISTDEPAFRLAAQAVALLTFSPTGPDQECAALGVSAANVSGGSAS